MTEKYKSFTVGVKKSKYKHRFVFLYDLVPNRCKIPGRYE